MLGTKEAQRLITTDLWPAFKAERKRTDRIRTWYSSNHTSPWMPSTATREFKQLAELACTPWGRLVVVSVAQLLFVDGFRQEEEDVDAPAWSWWQANGMDARQAGLHRDALAYGIAYETVIPGENDQGEKIPVMRPVSPRRMVGFYRDEGEDDWPEYVLRCDPAKVDGEKGWSIRLYDDQVVHYLQCGDDLDKLTYLEHRGHDAPVTPVVRFRCSSDTEGTAEGEIEPFVSMFARIDQTTFDRLVVQRFASWVVRTIAGLAKPDDGSSAEAEKQRLSAEKILVAEDPDTKFGSLPASPLDGFISARKADIEDLAACSQTPGNVLLKGLDNPPSAEALAADEAGLHRKTGLVRVSFGESHEQSFRLAAAEMGDAQGARDVTAQVRWRDMQNVSLIGVADAFSKLKDILPAEMLLEQLPGMTDTDVKRAKRLVENGSPLDRLVAEIRAGQTQPAA